MRTTQRKFVATFGPEARPIGPQPCPPLAECVEKVGCDIGRFSRCPLLVAADFDPAAGYAGAGLMFSDCMPRVMPHESGGQRFWWRYGGEFGQTFEVLNGSGEQELVPCSSETA